MDILWDLLHSLQTTSVNQLKDWFTAVIDQVFTVKKFSWSVGSWNLGQTKYFLLEEFFFTVTFLLFSLSLSFHLVIYYERWSENYFIEEFAKRLKKHLLKAEESLEQQGHGPTVRPSANHQSLHHLHQVIEHFFAQTFSEIYQKRDQFMRRKWDRWHSFLDTSFNIRAHIISLMEDLFFLFKYLQHYKKDQKDFLKYFWKNTSWQNVLRVLRYFPLLMMGLGVFGSMVKAQNIMDRFAHTPASKETFWNYFFMIETLNPLLWAMTLSAAFFITQKIFSIESMSEKTFYTFDLCRQLFHKNKEQFASLTGAVEKNEEMNKEVHSELPPLPAQDFDEAAE